MRLIYFFFIFIVGGSAAGCASRSDGPNDTKPSELAELPKDATTALAEQIVIEEGGLLLDRAVLPTADRSEMSVERVPISKVDDEPIGLPKSRPSQPRNFPVTVRFAGTRLGSVLQVFAKSAGYNLVSEVNDPDAAVDLSIDGLPWLEAFDLLQEVQALETIFDDKLNLMRVYDRGGLAQVEEGIIEDALAQVNRVERFRRLSTRSPNEPRVIERFMLRHIEPGEAATELNQAIEALYGDSDTPQEFKPSIVADLDPASLIMRGTKRQLDEAAALLSQIDILPRQVIIEAFFVEVGDDFEQALGARLSGDTSNPNRFLLGTGGSDEAFNFLPEDGSFGVTLIDGVSAGQLRLELSALEADNLSRTVSAPKILTRSGEEGQIARTTTKYYEDITISRDEANNEIETSEIKELLAPLRLTITPTVVGSYIHMDVSLENTNFAPRTDPDLPPDKNTVTVETGKLILQTGEVVVVGGVTSQSASDGQRGVPGISQTPGIGRLFREDQQSNDLNQLLIFIAPRVI